MSLSDDVATPAGHRLDDEDSAEADLLTTVVGTQHSAAPLASQRVNWAALITMAAVLAVIGWFLFQPTAREQRPVNMNSGGVTSGDPTAVMEDVQKQLAGLKAKLQENPLDLAALDQLCVMYGQVGQGDKAQPYIEKAIEAWKSANPTPDEAALQALTGISIAALDGGDYAGAINTLELYYSHVPGNLTLSMMLGNLCRDAGQVEDAVKWYTEYLKTATPDIQGEEYWSALVKRAKLYLLLAQSNDDAQLIESAVADMRRMTDQAPEHWQGWQTLGQAYLQSGKNTEALAAFKEADARATIPHDKWEAQTQIARLEGKPLPPEPAQQEFADDPHGGSMANPHGEMPKPPPGTPNPHGEMSPPSSGAANPHGGI